MEIQLAVKAKLRSFTFEGSELRLRPSCNVFITMNPGYAGGGEQEHSNLGCLLVRLSKSCSERGSAVQLHSYCRCKADPAVTSVTVSLSVAQK
jgi:hypothetical protein